MTRVLNAQNGWADPLGEWTQKRIWVPIFRSVQPLKNFLHGTWLGHSLHAALTDVPVGAFTAAIVLDVANARTGADIAIAVGVVGMLGAMLAGWADYADTDVAPQRGYATVHQLLMILALVLYIVSLAMRLNAATLDRALPITISVIGYVIIAVSAYIGGEVVYGLGNMVDRHAFRSFGAKWQPLELGNIAENTPAKAKAGGQSLVVVRRGERVYALHDICAHAGCNLSDGGKLVGDAIQCPCHGSRYRLDNGHVLQGPATFDQPVYEVRRTPDGKFEARRAGGGPGQ